MWFKLAANSKKEAIKSAKERNRQTPEYHINLTTIHLSKKKSPSSTRKKVYIARAKYRTEKGSRYD